MTIDEHKLNRLKQAVEETFGSPLNSPADFNALTAKILSATSKNLGVSTVQRVWGYVKSPHSPTYTTLSVLARFAGFPDWHAFCAHVGRVEESGFGKKGIIIAAELEEGTTLKVEWHEGKWCLIQKTNRPSEFKVLQSANIKLQPGDIFTTNMLKVGDKFVAADCQRNGVSLGSYTGAHRHGIEAIGQDCLEG